MAGNAPRAREPFLGPTWHTIQSRVVSGLFLCLPFVITVWVIYWIYSTLQGLILDRLYLLIHEAFTTQAIAALPRWWNDYVAPIVAVLLALLLFYVLGFFVQSRLFRAVNGVMARVPVVATLYGSLSSLFISLKKQMEMPPASRIVLVEFPHPGMRSLGVVTNQVEDIATGRKILCVCVLTGVLPPAGFTLFVPEEGATDTGWTMQQLIQSVMSGGLTIPETVPYFAAPASAAVSEHQETGAPVGST